MTLDIDPIFMASERGELEIALRVVAAALKQTVRSGDMVGRRARRTFAILALDAQVAGTVRLAERLRETMPGHITIMTREIPFTISLGIAVLPDSGQTLPEILRAAEAALADAVAAGGNRVRISSQEGIRAPRASQEEAPVAQAPLAIEQARIMVQQRESLLKATKAIEDGASEGITIVTRPGACPVCLDAARDIYLPRFAPPLPLTGCSHSTGCRCVYSAAEASVRRQPPSVPALEHDTFEIASRLHDAAVYGADPKNSCKSEELAEYLDQLPLLPFQPDVELQSGEAAYLVRPAKRAWEYRTSTGPVITGPIFPLQGSLSDWLRGVGRAPSIPDYRLPSKEDGLIYITNWRVIFRKGRAIDSILLADVRAVELLADGIACRVAERPNRLVFLLHEALQVGLCLTRAVRDVAALPR